MVAKPYQPQATAPQGQPAVATKPTTAAQPAPQKTAETKATSQT